MARSKIFSMLEKVTGIPFYQDLIPETAKLPAGSFIIISESDESAISGRIDLQRYYIQVDLATDTARLDTDSIKNKIKRFNMQPYKPDFQLIRIINIQDVKKSPGVDFFQTIIDVEFTLSAVERVEPK